jgi:hypothetical protein
VTVHTTPKSAPAVESVDARRLLWTGPLALASALLGNGALFATGMALGAFPADVIVPAAGQPISLAPVLFSTTVGVVGGILLYALLGRFTRRPATLFRRSAVAVLLLSLITPFSVPGGSPLFYAALLAMHLVAGLACIVILTRRSITS